MYEANLSAFVRTAAAICGREAGRDAVHDAFVALVQTRDRFRRAGTVEAWAWAAVVRQAQKRAARQREVPMAELGNERGGRAAQPAEPELAELRDAVASLPERQRLALFLRYYGDLEYAQIADVLEIKRGTVSATLHAAHQTLRARFDQERIDVGAL